MGNENSSSAATKAPTGPEVFLNVYTNGDKSKGGGFSVPGFGVYHSGLEINSTEYTFAGSPEAQGTGLQTQTPKQTPNGSQWVFKESISLGRTDLSSKEIQSIMSDLRKDFPANKYDLMTCNCNHFTELTAYRLNVHSKYPSWVNRAAKVGGAFKGGMTPLEEHKMKRAVAEQKQAEQRKKQEKKQEIQEKLKLKQQQLKPEPNPDTTPPERIYTIQLNLPSGAKAKRTFLDTDTLLTVMQFATCFDATLPSTSNFRLSSNFPKKEYTDVKQTIKAAGLSRSENLYVRVR